MKLLQIHNHYRFRGGEDVMFEQVCSILREHGHEVSTFERHSANIQGIRAKLRAFGTGVYSREARGDMATLIRTVQPVLAHLHNPFPLISPSVLEACRDANLPVVMRCPNYRLICPTGLHLRNGKPCTLCAGGREYWCALTNCRGDLVESTAMAARGGLVRLWGLIARNVRLFVPPSECVKRHLVASGIPADRIQVIPNTVRMPAEACNPASGNYVAFAGRLSEEKGTETLLQAAALLPEVPFRIAGEGHLLAKLQAMATPNVRFVGQLSRSDLDAFYSHARICVVPSVWHEAFGLVAAEASAMGLPVVASNMGALPEIVDDGSTGLLFPSEDHAALAARLLELWAAPEHCRAMGLAGRDKVRREYSREVYYGRLMRMYARALGVEAEEIASSSASLARPA